MNRIIRILLVDDHTLFRESLRRLLEAEPGLQVIGAVANADDAVTFALDHKPDMVLMDIDISKREPQLAFLVPGATNAPIATKDARTRLVVRDGGTGLSKGIELERA